MSDGFYFAQEPLLFFNRSCIISQDDFSQNQTSRYGDKPEQAEKTKRKHIRNTNMYFHKY